MTTATVHHPYRFTVCEYLAFERTACDRHEYLDGLIYAMAGESLAHGRLCTNLTMLLATHLRGTPCEVLSKDTKVRSGPARADSREGLYSYPDVVVVCGAPQSADDSPEVLEHPRVLIEVLSPTTAAFDRGEKWDRYRTWLPSLQDYVLVAQDRPAIEHWHRQPDGTWHAALIEGLGAMLRLASIDCSLLLQDIYERVVLPGSE